MAGQKAENAKDEEFFSNARRAEAQARRGNVVPRKVSRLAGEGFHKNLCRERKRVKRVVVAFTKRDARVSILSGYLIENAHAKCTIVCIVGCKTPAPKLSSEKWKFQFDPLPSRASVFRYVLK